jgi:hypothetical protein
MNIPLTGNSEEKNRKWPRLYLLATATLLLSAISFIGVGAIPQSQQAFAQVEDEDEDEDEEPMNATNAANATTTSPTDGGGAGGEEDDDDEDDEESMNNNGDE